MWTEASDKIQSFLKEKCCFLNYKINPLTGDASSRKYFRVVTSNGTNYVLMAWEPFQSSTFPFFSVIHHFKKHQINVPEVIQFDESLGLVLLEDLGDITLNQIFYEAIQPSSYQTFYDQAISELIKIHFVASRDPSPCIAFDLDFNIEKLSWELNFTKTHLFEGLLEHQYSSTENSIYEKSVYQICKILHEQPKYIQHRDYHSRNLMIKDNKLRVIDFQDARMGPIQYDLVSLFKDSYVDFPEDLELKYLKFYFTEAYKYNYPNMSFEQFLHVYNLQAIQRCLKACGSFASFYNLKNDSRYLQYLKPTLAKIRKLLNEFNEFVEYKEFSEIIINTGAFNL